MLMSVDAHLHKQRTSARTASYGAAFFSDDDDDDDDDDADDDDDVDDVGTISGKKVFFGDVVHLWRHERSKLGGLGVIKNLLMGLLGLSF